jgi:hypothetical protein
LVGLKFNPEDDDPQKLNENTQKLEREDMFYKLPPREN